MLLGRVSAAQDSLLISTEMLGLTANLWCWLLLGLRFKTSKVSSSPGYLSKVTTMPAMVVILDFNEEGEGGRELINFFLP